MIVAKSVDGDNIKCATVVHIPDLLTQDAEDVAWELFLQESAAAIRNGDGENSAEDVVKNAFVGWQEAMTRVAARVCVYLKYRVAGRMSATGNDAFYAQVDEYLKGADNDTAGSN